MLILRMREVDQLTSSKVNDLSNSLERKKIKEVVYRVCLDIFLLQKTK